MAAPASETRNRKAKGQKQQQQTSTKKGSSKAAGNKSNLDDGGRHHIKEILEESLSKNLSAQHRSKVLLGPCYGNIYWFGTLD